MFGSVFGGRDPAARCLLLIWVVMEDIFLALEIAALEEQSLLVSNKGFLKDISNTCCLTTVDSFNNSYLVQLKTKNRSRQFYITTTTTTAIIEKYIRNSNSNIVKRNIKRGGNCRRNNVINARTSFHDIIYFLSR